jgi:Clustered mitochondria
VWYHSLITSLSSLSLTALSVYPCSSTTRETLRYGSCDSGKTVHADIDELNELMACAGTSLRLEPHLVGSRAESARELCSCGDLEVHQGKDGKYYVLDFSRFMPPEAPFGVPRGDRGIFYRLLRPEFVSRSPMPLNPDSFSAWSRLDPRRTLLNKRSIIATEYLFRIVIPRFASRMDRFYVDQLAHLSGIDGVTTASSTSSSSTASSSSSSSTSASSASSTYSASSTSLAENDHGVGVDVDVDVGVCVAGRTDPAADPLALPIPLFELHERFRLVEELHRAGLSLRHMGLVSGSVCLSDCVRVVDVFVCWLVCCVCVFLFVCINQRPVCICVCVCACVCVLQIGFLFICALYR